MTEDISMDEVAPQLPTGTGIIKLPPIPKGATVRKRAIPMKTATTRSAHRIHVTPKTPFRSVTSRVRKQLDKYLREASASNKTFTNRLAGRKNASLEHRVRALQNRSERNPGGNTAIGLENAGEVVVVGTGRAIQKVVEVAHFFQKQPDCVVRLRTASVGAIDDVIMEDEDEEELGLAPESKERVRMMSCLEASIWLR
ncbi:Rpp20 subunit of nuclear RNase MRP and P-domain-containing protein [Xylariomycetidae sp. FL2044]|nr:Rpp20 subunit of nuclear RNase MRP and P-domain-containing protein [Xylariomycetidae sp. FL2044]